MLLVAPKNKYISVAVTFYRLENDMVRIAIELGVTAVEGILT